jgi:hypothetical protein
MPLAEVAPLSREDRRGVRVPMSVSIYGSMTS